MMFGYACDETDEYMPLAISYAHALAKQLEILRQTKKLGFFRTGWQDSSNGFL